MNKIIELVTAEAESIRFIKLSLLTADDIESMYYQFEACFEQSKAFDLYKALNVDETEAYYKLMSVMTFVEELI